MKDHRSAPKLTAADLIARATERLGVEPSAALMAELKALCEHNDRAGSRRVGRRDAMKLCLAHGVKISTEGLDKLCTKLGRKSYAQK